MLPKYKIEYTIPFRKHARTSQYSSDDPVACEDFIEELLEHGFRIRAIKHEGINLPKQDFDKMIKTAASRLSSRRICVALGIKPDEERYRFGFSA
jgi:hypothetical protein